MKPVLITGTGLYTPSESISNDELVACFNQYVNEFNAHHAAEIEAGTCVKLEESSTGFIEKASGIRARYVMNKSGVLDSQRMAPDIPERPDDQHSIMCEMALAAAQQALVAAGKQASDIDAVICAASNMQRAYPAMAVEIQHALGAGGYGYDMNVACSSATFGIQAAMTALQTGQANCVLVVNPEITSGHLNWRDRDSHFIFGDACTALILERAEDVPTARGFEILGCQLKTRFSNNIRNNFGFLNRAAPEGIGQDDKLFKQQGRKVFKEVCPMAAEMITATLGQSGLDVQAVKRFWLHQANLNMNQLIVRMLLGRDAVADEAPIILDRYANTSSAGSIIAFHLHQDNLMAGDTGVICSFGAGYSIGCVVVKKVA